MENIEKIIIGIILFTLTSTIAYLFKMRQLYVATPRLYDKSNISTDGAICEIAIYNNGNHPEEEITLTFDPNLKVELIATNNSELTSSKNQIKLARLHKYKSASAILMVEGGDFDYSKINDFSSKATTGKILKPKETPPPNWAALFVIISFMLAILPVGYYCLVLNDRYQEYSAKQELEPITSLGWSGLNSYHKSDLSQSYSKSEFPAKVYDVQTDKNGDKLASVDIYNKTALDMLVYIDAKGFEDKNGELHTGFFKSVSLTPLSMKTITIKIPAKPTSETGLPVSFSFSSGTEFVNGIKYNLVY